MERLTYRDKDGMAMMKERGGWKSWGIDRLAAYEDTGLEPDVCSNYRKFEDEAISKGVTFKRIVELMNADHDGRLVLLPCKVGDDVWFVRKFGKERCITQREVDCVNIDSRGNVFVSARRISGGYIGKTVFLTREEAEAALAQKGGEG